MAQQLTLSEIIQQRSIPEPNTGCQLWIGPVQRDGYGQFSHRGRLLLAHRAAWEALHGPIPTGKSILHNCDMPCCVNAEHHLYVGSQLDNMHDCIVRKRHRNSKKTRCIHGPEFHEPNPYVHVRSDGRRQRMCRICLRLRAQRRRAE